MPDILIRGMEMPKDNNATSIIIFSNGKVSLAHDKKYAEYAEAVPLPEGHGRLIDADALEREISDAIYNYWNGGDNGFYLAEDALPEIRFAPTIVPAEGGTEDDGNA